MFNFRRPVIDATNELFAQAPYPIDTTGRFRGDPGLYGPQSITWPVLGDAAVFVGGIRALLVQAAHPEVVAGVFDYSRFREDPLGRLARTSAYVTATAFGAMPEVERAIRVVHAVHRPVAGTSHRDRAYSAAHPSLAAWVHNALTESFLASYQHYGARSLSASAADQFVAEQARLGALIGASPLPVSAEALARWVDELPDLAPSPGMVDAIGFLRSPPLAPPVRIVYRVLFEAAVTTLPPRVRSILELPNRPGAHASGTVATRLLRWALGSSPSWRVALERAGAPAPVERAIAEVRRSGSRQA